MIFVLTIAGVSLSLSSCVVLPSEHTHGQPYFHFWRVTPGKPEKQPPKEHKKNYNQENEQNSLYGDSGANDTVLFS